MRIGVDIDGVVSDSYPFWLQELNQYFGKNITDVTDYDMHRVFDIPREDLNNYFVSNSEHLLSMPKPISGAKEGIDTLLREGHEVIFVTARTPEERDVTLRWLTLSEIPYDQVLFTGFKSKVDVVRQWKIEVFIEDYSVNAQLIAASGVPVLLLDASYNQAEVLPKDISRCHSWEEILDGIRRFNP